MVRRAAILLFSLSGASYDPLLSPLMVLAGLGALTFCVLRDRHASDGRILPSQAGDIGHPIANGLLTTFLMSLCLMSFLVYGALLLMELYAMNPLQASLVVLIESLAWGSAAVLLSGTRKAGEPWLIRAGAAMVVLGLVGVASTFPYGHLWGLIAMVIVLNAGMGMMWGFIIKRVIGAAPAGEKDRASSILPITLQTGFALGAAISGLIANGLELDAASDAATLQQVCFWLFAGFVPLALVGNWFALRFVDPRRQA